MKKLTAITFAFALSFGAFAQQNDTIFIHTHSPPFIYEFATAEIDSIIFYRTQPRMTQPRDTAFDTIPVFDTIIHIDTIIHNDTITHIDTIIHIDTITHIDTIIHNDTIIHIDTIIRFDTIIYTDTIQIFDTIITNALQEKIDSLKIELGIANGTLVRDIDGNIYRTIKIGNQVWFAENLRVTQWNCGTPIEHMQDGEVWRERSQSANRVPPPMYCYVDISANGIAKYGVLYNWPTVNPANGRQLCPIGWRVPTLNDFQILRDWLIANGYNYDGTTTENKIGKSMATKSGWIYSDVVGSIGNTDFSEKRNASGFSALPFGRRNSTGAFTGDGSTATFWTSSSATWNGFPMGRYARLSFGRVDLFICPNGDFIGQAQAIRCIRD